MHDNHRIPPLIMEETTFYVDTGKGFNLSAGLQLKPNAPSEGIVILCHGILNTRFSKTILCVIERIPYHTLSFDFQGNGLSGGTTTYGNYYEEVENIRCIITYVRENLNPRYDHTEAPSNRFKPEQLEELQKKGSFVWIKYSDREYIIRDDDLKERNNLDTSVVRNIDKQKVKVLTIHGSKDEVCSVKDAYIYDKLIGPEPYHKLMIVQDADHRFGNINHQKIMAGAITSWLDENKSWVFNEIGYV
ncbi:unnamed protein product [Rhizophagus irregularis]|uniref:Peptidase S9 prolyl oligopeptidase catalytic domain-containing protein n=1 Tax=Rhizophagus irregularis TaxID=588596 RepID=A0A915YP47_9GLOM|nr:alpha/beta hydrolase protein [Rhizophagus irregularis DAOM 181602=DAOM 197198]CAB5299488.1 unnamed protein product [Rhizophagus irregularis]